MIELCSFRQSIRCCSIHNFARHKYNLIPDIFSVSSCSNIAIDQDIAECMMDLYTDPLNIRLNNIDYFAKLLSSLDSGIAVVSSCLNIGNCSNIEQSNLGQTCIVRLSSH